MSYKIIRCLFTYCLLVLFGLSLHGQNVLVKGRSHLSYAGKQITLYTLSDYISEFRIRESHDTIDAEGYFELPLQAEFTQPVILKIDNVISKLYVQPDFVYGITIPELDQEQNINKDVELTVNIGVVGKDSTELNALIFDYENIYNSMFSQTQEQFVSRQILFKRGDSLQRLCDKRYAGIKNDYFKSYIRYSLAAINASLSRGENFLIHNYITNKPVQYGHENYMTFFRSIFRGYLAQMASQRKGESLYNIINGRADYDALLNFVRYEKQLRSDTIRELIILSELWNFYFSKEFEPEAVGRIIAKLNQNTKVPEHKKISANMLAFINKLQVGTPAPAFQVIARDGRVLDWSAYKGRWVYINFFSTSNTASLKEMPKIASLKKKFGDKLVFLSICLDDSVSSYHSYLAANPRYDWLICYDKPGAVSKGAKQAYALTGTEGYFLINHFGLIAAAPALPPSQGIEYRLNIIFKVKQRNTKTGIR